MAAAASERVETNPAGKSDSPASSVVIVDLGKQKRKEIKELRKGTGKLMDEVRDTLAELRGNGTISSTAEPVVLIVREKLRKPKMWF